MPTDVVMPQMGESIFEGTITKWLKKVGDAVERDEPLFEISTDKVDAEIPSPVAGTLTEIKVQEGATVGINAVVAVVSSVLEGAQEAQLQEAADGSVSAETPNQAVAASTAAAQSGIEVVMPQMGESIFEGTITKWLKKVGQTVEKDELLFEISTDKVDAEIPSPVAGILTEIKVPQGETVSINTVVAVIGGSGRAAVDAAVEDLPAAEQPAKPSSTSQPLPAPAFEPAGEATAAGQPRSSPLVRRMAKEHQLDLRHIVGTGSAGRINKEDVLRHLSAHGPGKNPALAASAPVQSRAASQAASSAPTAASALPGTVAPLSRMRSMIADRMVESVAVSPHVYVVYKIDMTRVVRLRERERNRFEQQHGVKLTYMPFIAAAAVEALRKHPIVNASLLGSPDVSLPDLSLPGKARSIHYHANIHLGIAVALDWGLIVPVLKQAESMSFAQLARTMADLAERARGKKLKPEEASGSTFTLTNFGVFGGEFGTPIINQPESAILAIGGLKKEPVVLTDAEGDDTLAIRSMQSYCLGFDHRLIDGADAGKFMTEFKNALEGWDRSIG